MIKNRLATRAVQGTALEGLAELFEGPTAIAFSETLVSASTCRSQVTASPRVIAAVALASPTTSTPPQEARS